jgi:hypothetical protein
MQSPIGPLFGFELGEGIIAAGTDPDNRDLIDKVTNEYFNDFGFGKPAPKKGERLVNDITNLLSDLSNKGSFVPSIEYKMSDEIDYNPHPAVRKCEIIFYFDKL